MKKKLLITIAFSLLCSATLFPAFELIKDDVMLKATSYLYQNNFANKIGADTENYNQLVLQRKMGTFFGLGYNPIEFHITNSSNKRYRVSLSSIHTKCLCNYKEVYKTLGSLSSWHDVREAFAAFGVTFGSMVGALGWILGLAALDDGSPEAPLIIIGAGVLTLVTLVSALGLVKINYDARSLGKKFAHKFVQPESVIIEPGQQIKLFAILNNQAYGSSGFLFSLVNADDRNDILSFNVVM